MLKFFTTVVAAVAAALSSEAVLNPSSVAIRFDPECKAGGEKTLFQFMTERLKLTRAVDVEQFAFVYREMFSNVTRAVERSVNIKDRVESARRHKRSMMRLNIPAEYRTLGRTAQHQREDEIVTVLHILTAVKIFEDKEIAVQFLRAEQSSDQTEMARLLASAVRLRLSAQNIDDQLRSLRKYNPVQYLTQVESLEFLEGYKIIKNPFLDKDILPLAQSLPCLVTQPEFDRGYESPPVPEGEVVPKLRLRTGSRSVKVDILDYATLKLRLEEEQSTGRPSLKTTSNQTYYLILPNDIHEEAYYMPDYSEEKPAGSDILSGWAYIIRKIMVKKDPSIIHRPTVTLDIKTLLEDQSIDWQTVAVTDSGCSKHPDLVNKFWRNLDTPGCTPTSFVGTGPNPQENDCIGYDFEQDQPDVTTGPTPEFVKHGTACAGLVGAEVNNGEGITGVCPNCKIMCLSIKRHDTGLYYTNSDLRANNYILKHGVRISSHSYGSYGYNGIKGTALEQSLRTLEKAGSLWFASAGNDALDLDPLVAHPEKPLGYYHRAGGAGDENVITVCNIKKSGSMASSTNWGKDLCHVFAPGNKVASTYYDGGVKTVSGTSFSTPITAGVAAVVLSVYPDLTIPQLKETLVASARPWPTVKDKCISKGVISLSRALAYAEKFFPDEDLPTINHEVPPRVGL